MSRERTRLLASILVMLFLSLPGNAQEEKKTNRAASLDGTTGLFKAWDAETLKRFEGNFTVGWSRYNRDPGELKFDTLPVGFAFGLHNRLEFFGSFDALKRIEARGIRDYHTPSGSLPRPAQSPLGRVNFTNDAPFIDVPLANGVGDVRIGAKFSLLSERRGNPFSMSLVGFLKVPTHDTSTRFLNRGLGTGELDKGYGYLFSKTAGKYARLHFNLMLNFVGDPDKNNTPLAELQNELQYKGGGAFPSYGKAQFIAEIDGKLYYGARSLGLNPRSPVDLIVGVRFYPNSWVSFGGGYRASMRHVVEDVGQRVFPADTNGFVAQLAMGRRSNAPPSVTCAISNATIKQDEKTTIRANAKDPDGDTLTYSWTSSGGKVTGSGDTATFDATGVAPGKYTVTATVSDGKHQASCSVEVTVVKKNLPPTVSCSPSSASVTLGESITIRATASDPNNDRLTYSWTVNGQRIAEDGPSITFGTQGRQPGTYTITATVSDGEFTASCTSSVTVSARPNRPPTIQCLTTSMDVASGGSVQLQVRTSDPDNDRVTVSWSTTGGRVTGSGQSATFSAEGLKAGTYTVTATADDGRGGRASCTMTVTVSERQLLCSGFAPKRFRADNVCKAALDDLAVRMQNDSRLRANIIGYTDGSKLEAAVKGLGGKRANAVADYLKKKGIDASRLTVTDGAASNPPGDTKTAAGRKLNRRVEIELTIR